MVHAVHSSLHRTVFMVKKTILVNGRGKLDQTVRFGSVFIAMDVHYNSNLNLHYRHKNLVNVVHICKGKL